MPKITQLLSDRAGIRTAQYYVASGFQHLDGNPSPAIYSLHGLGQAAELLSHVSLVRVNARITTPVAPRCLGEIKTPLNVEVLRTQQAMHGGPFRHPLPVAPQNGSRLQEVYIFGELRLWALSSPPHLFNRWRGRPWRSSG